MTGREGRWGHWRTGGSGEGTACGVGGAGQDRGGGDAGRLCYDSRPWWKEPGSEFEAVIQRLFTP